MQSCGVNFVSLFFLLLFYLYIAYIVLYCWIPPILQQKHRNRSSEPFPKVMYENFFFFNISQNQFLVLQNLTTQNINLKNGFFSKKYQLFGYEKKSIFCYFETQNLPTNEINRFSQRKYNGKIFFFFVQKLQTKTYIFM